MNTAEKIYQEVQDFPEALALEVLHFVEFLRSKNQFSINQKLEQKIQHGIDQAPGSRYFCESFYGHPCPTSGKNYATANACGGPSRPASFVGYPARGIQHHSRNDSTRCRKACIFTTQKALREDTCTIASGDYSTPVSQRMMA